MNFSTADLCDAHADEVQVCEPLFADYGGRRSFHGAIRTLKCFEDNSLVREALVQAGNGSVLVVDAGGSRRCAMLGDQLAELAVNNGWTGILMYGMVRDSEAIGRLPLGIKALGTLPLKSVKRGEGQPDILLRFAGASFAPGDWLYADADGIVVSRRPLHRAG